MLSKAATIALHGVCYLCLAIKLVAGYFACTALHIPALLVFTIAFVVFFVLVVAVWKTLLRFKPDWARKDSSTRENPFVYDKGEHHRLGLSSDASTWEEACGPMLFFFRWALEHDLLSQEFRASEVKPIAACRSGAISIFQLFEDHCDMTLDSDLLSPDCDAFARVYYNYNTGRYLTDLSATFSPPAWRSSYPCTEETYPRMRPILDQRYSAWKAGDHAPLLAPKRTPKRKLGK